MESIIQFKKKFPQEIFSWCQAVDEKFGPEGCVPTLNMWADWFFNVGHEKITDVILLIVERHYMPYKHDFSSNPLYKVAKLGIRYGWYAVDGMGCPHDGEDRENVIRVRRSWLPNKVFWHIEKNGPEYPKHWHGKYAQTPSDAYIKLIIAGKELLTCNTT